MKSINPATNQIIQEYHEYSSQEVESILASVNEDWLGWKQQSIEDRAVCMHKAADLLLEHRDECARIITSEMGKLIKESRAEVEKCALVCRTFADEAVDILRDQAVVTDFKKSLVAFEPLGIILAVMPWNFPFWQVWRFIAPALMAGNAAVLKHASNVSGCALKIEEIVRQAGFPQNLFRSLLISSGKVEAVVSNPLVKAVTLTGSEPAGAKVAAVAGNQLKKSVLELGGSDPFIVLEDADLDKAIQTSITARLLNAGQVCISAKRFIVMEAVAEQFIARQKALMESLVVDDPMEETTQLAPMSREDLLEEVHEQVERSIAAGAQLVTGGKRLDRPGNFYAPTILTQVKKGMPAYDDEIFGPVSAIITVKSEEEAIEVANDTPFGLGASVWTKDENKGERLARKIESGMVFVNSMVVSHPKLPFGGIKRSGYGRECSDYGMKEFVNIKTICVK